MNTKSVLDLRNAERDAAGRLVGRGGQAETLQTHLGDETLQYFLALSPLQQRIYALLLKAKRAVSRRELTKELGLKKTGWFIAGLEGLVERGYITRSETNLSNGMVCFWYEVVR